MDHLLLESALRICFNIFGKAYPKIKNISAGVIVKEDSKDKGDVELLLYTPPYRQAFAAVEVELIEVSMEKETLQIEIFAEFRHDDITGMTSFKDETIESIINKYENLKPLVRESINDFMDVLTNPAKPVRKIGRTMAVRYRIHDQSYESDEDYEYDYNVD
jgi:hypothetical protein